MGPPHRDRHSENRGRIKRTMVDLCQERGFWKTMNDPHTIVLAVELLKFQKSCQFPDETVKINFISESHKFTM